MVWYGVDTNLFYNANCYSGTDALNISDDYVEV